MRRCLWKQGVLHRDYLVAIPMKTDASTAYPPDFTERSASQFMISRNSHEEGGFHSGEASEICMAETSSLVGKQICPPPCGYVSWEALLASDGDSDAIKNPRQEVASLFATIIPENVCLLERIAEERYAELLCAYQNEISCTDHTASASLVHFMQETRYLFEDIATVPVATKESILRFMKLQLSRVQHDCPNRWVASSCWSGMRDAHQWKTDWQIRYFPEAIAALHVAERKVADPLLAEATIKLRSQLERWREKARVLSAVSEEEPFSRDPADLQGWGAIELCPLQAAI